MSGQDGFLTFVAMMTAQLVTKQSSPFRQLTRIASEGDLLDFFSNDFSDWFISVLAVHLRHLLKALNSGRPQNGYSEALLSLFDAYSSFVCLGCHRGKILNRDWGLLSELLSNYRHCAMQVQLGPLLQDARRKDGQAGWMGIRRPPRRQSKRLPKVVVPMEHYVLKDLPFYKEVREADTKARQERLD
ncbi:hypothetical protein AAG906_031119 [Vitis piasezkii]